MPLNIDKLYGTLLGRLVILCFIVFLAIHNATLGLLAVLVIITISNKFGSFSVEGMENQDTTPTTIGDENANNNGEQIVLTGSAAKKISEIKQSIADGTLGVDKEDIKKAIMSKDSNAIPVDPNMNSSDEVIPSTTAMINSSKSNFEGFMSFASL
jgi:anti-sigma28 factor (negative regulator of flagellin synthesis)